MSCSILSHQPSEMNRTLLSADYWYFANPSWSSFPLILPFFFVSFNIIKSTSPNCESLPSQRLAIIIMVTSGSSPTVNLDSLKNWNNHFFGLMHPSILSLFPWYKDVFSTEDLLLSEDVKLVELVISEPNPTIAGKTLAALRKLSIQSGQHDVGSGFTAHPTYSKHMDTDAIVSQKVILIYHMCILRLKSGHRNFIDHTPPPGYWAYIRNLSDAEFLNRLNANSDQHMCMMYELCVRYENEITIRERFEKKFVKSSETIQQKDAEIATLRYKLEKAEGEATYVVVLRRRVSELKTEGAAKAEDLASLSVHNVELLGKGLRDEIAGEAKMRVEFMSIQDAEAQPVAGCRWMIGHSLRLAVMKCSQSIEYRATLENAIYIAINKSIQEGLEARIEHGKVGRSLAELEAYDSRVAVGYVSTVNELENVSFLIIDELEALNDSPLELLMLSLTLEEDHGEKDSTPEFCSHEILLSDALAASRARAEKRKKGASLSLEVGGPSVAMPSVSFQEAFLVVANYQISSVATVDATVPAHDDLFDTSLLDKSVDHQVTFLQVLDVPGSRKYVSAFVPDFVCSLFKCLYHFIRSFPFWAQFFSFLRMAIFIASVYKVSWLEALSRFSSGMSRLSIKASSFWTWSTSAHLNEGNPILLL
ncbi:hypothetical protein Tco_1262035 [Tanacetum coccineum]